MLTCPGVRKELERLEKLDFLLRYPHLEFDTPEEGDLDQVMEAARRTGDIQLLSPTDMELLALCLKHQGTLVSDDYAIQNLCSQLGLQVISLSEKGIREKFKWTLRCRGCGRFFEDEPGSVKKSSTGKRTPRDCPVCGSLLKVVRQRGKGRRAH